MNPNLRRLYLFHFFNSIAMVAVANPLFIDKLMLRAGLNMSQFGIVKGIAFSLPMVLNLLLAPIIIRLQIDRQIVAVGYLIRAFLPFVFLLLPMWTSDRNLLTLGFTITMLTIMIFPALANNSLAVLCKTHITRETLGKHTSMIYWIWNFPYAFLAPLLGWYLDRKDAASDAEFYRAFFLLFLLTTVLQIPSSWAAWRVQNPPKAATADTAPLWESILEPFKDVQFRLLINTLLMLSVVTSMVWSFINPYLMLAHHMSMREISFFTLSLTVAGAAIFPFWGKMADSFGGKNVLRISVLGMAAGVFCLSSSHYAFVLIFAALAGLSGNGFFGMGSTAGQQYLTLSLSNPARSNTYIAALGLAGGCDILLGSLLGGFLLDWLQTLMRPDHPYEHYRIYFTYCALGYLLLGGFIAVVRDGHRRISYLEWTQELYHSAKSLFLR
jgi:hypothetical protein